MLDVLSGGRLEVAFPLGTGMEYWANPVNPATARERHKESINIILKCWTEDGPTQHYGDFYTYRFLNPWTRPMQRPHPPCYIVGTGSPETIELAAELGFGYSAVFVTKKRARAERHAARRSAEHGHQMRPDQFPLGVMTYVAETQEKAEQEFSGPALLLRGRTAHDPQFLAPPAICRSTSLKRAPPSATSCTARSTSRWSAMRFSSPSARRTMSPI